MLSFGLQILLATEFFIVIRNRLLHNFLRFARTEQAPDIGLLILQLLIDREEMQNFVKDMFR